MLALEDVAAAAAASYTAAPRPSDNLSRRNTFSSSRSMRRASSSSSSSSPTVTSSASARLSRRRSVRSMKNLLPLTLNNTPNCLANAHHLHGYPRHNDYYNCYSLPTHSQPVCVIRGEMAAAVEASMDEVNFPELLARDLDISSLVFAAKNMTAGPPSRKLAYDEKECPPMPTIIQDEDLSSSKREDGQQDHPNDHAAAHEYENSDNDQELQAPVVRFQSSIRPATTSASSARAEKGATTSNGPRPDDALSEAGSSSSGPSFSEGEIEPQPERQQCPSTAAAGPNPNYSRQRKNSIGHDTITSWIDFTDDEGRKDNDEQPKETQREERANASEERQEVKATRPGPGVTSAAARTKNSDANERRSGEMAIHKRQTSANSSTQLHQRPAPPRDRFRTNSSPAQPQAATAGTGRRRLSNPFEGVRFENPPTPPPNRTLSLQIHPRPPTLEPQKRTLHNVELKVPQRRSSLTDQTLHPHYIGTDTPFPVKGEDIPDHARASHSAPTPAFRKQLQREHARRGEDVAVFPTKPEEQLEPGVVADDEATVEDGEVDRSSTDEDDEWKDDLEPWFRYVDEEDDGAAAAKRRTRTLREKKSQRLTYQPNQQPESPLENIQHWLDSSLDTQNLDAEQNNRRIRLPPETIETLRVSMNCFPETMLLCSSLSIETIRSYSRKVKHPVFEPQRITATPPVSPKRWKWSSVLGQRRSASAQTRDISNSTSGSDHYSNNASADATIRFGSGVGGGSSGLGVGETDLGGSGVAQPQWSRLRNIFPVAQDCLLDALYAHLVAYSYVSSLCHRSSKVSMDRKSAALATASPAASRGGGGGGRDSEDTRKSNDSNDIPRKAATLLGLQNAAADIPTADQPASPSSELAVGGSSGEGRKGLRKKSSFIDTLRSSRMPPAHGTASEDASMRELQIGLARCIARLVTTLRFGPGEDEEVIAALLADEDPKLCQIDPLLVRTLCEIVRCCEESC